MKRSAKLPGQKGFTLLETVVAIGLSVLILLALLLLFENHYKAFNSQQALIRAAGSASAAAAELQTAILQADQVVASHTFSGTTYTTGSNVLVLEIPSEDSSANIVAGKYDYEAFYLSGTKLYRIISADASSSRNSGTKQLSDTVSSILYTYNNADPIQSTKVDIDLSTQSIAGRTTVSYSLHETIYLRNKT